MINRDTLIGTSTASGEGIRHLLVKEYVEFHNGKVSIKRAIRERTNFKILLSSR